MILIMDDHLWEGTAGDAIREVFHGAYPMLPQLEPLFSVIQLDPDHVSYTNRIHRNLVVVDIEDNSRNIPSRGQQKEDKYSSGQTVYTFHAADVDAFIEKFKELGPSVAQDILQKDRKRIQKYHRKMDHPSASQQLQETMGLSLNLHKDFQKMEVSENFSWFTRERIQFLSGRGHDVIQGVAVYTYPYSSDSLLLPNSLIEKRNETLGEKVQSTLDSPMTVETLLPPEYRQIPFSGQYAIEGRGLWKFPKPIMGGPFISLTVVDESKGRVITVEGYVFAPKFDKKDFMLDVEAMVHSLTF